MTNTPQASGMLQMIQNKMSSMSKSEQMVCEYIVNHPQEVIHLCVSELAAASGVSDATVIRASQKISNGSYQDLRISLAQDIVTPLQAVNEAVHENDSAHDVMEKVFQSALHAITSTYNALSSDDVELAADKILAARRVIICGLGNSHAIAADMQHKFLRLGLDAAAYSDGHLQLIGISFSNEQDVLCAISHSGSSKDVVRAAEIAKSNGTYVISITHSGRSPLSDISDLALHTVSGETQYRAVALSSRIAQMSIVDALYTFIALKKPNAIDGFYVLEKNLGSTKY